MTTARRTNERFLRTVRNVPGTCLALWTLGVFIHGLGLSRSEAADWPTYRRDGRRSGVSSEELKLPLREIWIHRAAHAPRPAWPEAPARADFWHRLHGLEPTSTYDRAFHVAVVGGRLYYGSSADDTVRCIDAATGRERWSFVTGGPVRLAPTVAGGRLYVGSDDGRVYCLDAEEGRSLWRYTAGPEERYLPGNGRMISRWPVRCGIVVEGGVVYFASGLFPSRGVYLCAASAADGKEVWKRKIGVSSQGYLVASPERLFVPTGRTAHAAFDRRDGKGLGGFGKVGGCFALVADDMLVHGASENGQIHINDPASRENIVSTPGLRLVAGSKMVYVLGKDRLQALDRTSYVELSRQIARLSGKRKKTGEDKKRLAELGKQRSACLKWKVPVGARYSLIMAGGVLFAGGDGKVLGFDAATGRPVWTGKASGKAYGLAASAGRLYVSTDDGAIHCFGSGRALSRPRSVSAVSKSASSSPYPRDRLTPLREGVAGAAIEAAAPGDPTGGARRHAVGTNRGYCLVLGGDTGRLAWEIAKRSELQVIGVAGDERAAATARRALGPTGLYGTRIAVHVASPEKLPYPNYFANLIVSDGFLSTGRLSTPAAEVLRVLRPSGGALVLARSSGSFDMGALRRWGGASFPDWDVRRGEVGRHQGAAQMRGGEISAGVFRRGALPGAGEWTHGLADAGNTACSGDKLIGGELDLQWFGRPGPGRMPDRHLQNVSPLYRDGRLFIAGDSVYFALDAYNGTVLWEAEVPDSRRLGANLDSSHIAVDDKFLYVAAAGRCLRFDVRTGSAAAPFVMPQVGGKRRCGWGYLAWDGEMLFGSGRREGASYTEQSRRGVAALYGPNMKLVASDYLFGLDRRTGARRWVFKSGLIVNTTITVGDGRVYFIETTSPGALSGELGRMPLKKLFDGGKQYLVAVEARTGRRLYRKELDAGELQELVYLCYASDTLLLSGSKAAGKHLAYAFRAIDPRTGEVRWAKEHGTSLSARGDHGEQNRHPTILGSVASGSSSKVARPVGRAPAEPDVPARRGGVAYAWPYAYDLGTGERIAGWRMDRRGGGCGGVSGSARCLFWRGGNPWMYDLGPGGGAKRLTTVTRPGCRINIIPAGGLVLIPEASSGCSCGYSMQTSMALAPRGASP